MVSRVTVLAVLVLCSAALCGAKFTCPGGNKSEYLASAVQLYGEGHYTLAVECAGKAISRKAAYLNFSSKSATKARFIIGSSLYKMNKYSDAAKSFKQVLEGSGTRELKDAARVNLAAALYRANDLQEAADKLQDALAKETRPPTRRKADLALLNARLGNKHATRSMAQDIANDEEVEAVTRMTATEAMAMIADTRFERNKWYKQLRTFGKEGKVLANLGLALVAMDNDDQHAALRHLKEALEIQPNHVRSLIAMANLQRRLGQIRKAFDTLQRIAAIDPSNTEALRLHAQVHLSMEPRPDFYGALQRLYVVLAMVPNDFQSLCLLAYSKKLEEVQAAAVGQDIKAARKAMGGDTGGITGRFRGFLGRSGDSKAKVISWSSDDAVKAAQKSFDKMQRNGPSNRVVLAQTYLHLEDWEGAQTALGSCTTTKCQAVTEAITALRTEQEYQAELERVKGEGSREDRARVAIHRNYNQIAKAIEVARNVAKSSSGDLTRDERVENGIDLIQMYKIAGEPERCAEWAKNTARSNCPDLYLPEYGAKCVQLLVEGTYCAITAQNRVSAASLSETAVDVAEAMKDSRRIDALLARVSALNFIGEYTEALELARSNVAEMQKVGGQDAVTAAFQLAALREESPKIYTRLMHPDETPAKLYYDAVKNIETSHIKSAFNQECYQRAIRAFATTMPYDPLTPEARTFFKGLAAGFLNNPEPRSGEEVHWPKHGEAAMALLRIDPMIAFDTDAAIFRLLPAVRHGWRPDVVFSEGALAAFAVYNEAKKRSPGCKHPLCIKARKTAYNLIATYGSKMSDRIISDPRLLFLLGRSSLAQKSLVRAQATFEKLVHIDETNADGWRFLARVMYLRGRPCSDYYKKAEQHGADLSEDSIDGAHSALCHVREMPRSGRCSSELEGSLDSSLSSVKSAITKVQLQMARSLCHSRAGEHSEAQSAANAAVQKIADKRTSKNLKNLYGTDALDRLTSSYEDAGEYQKAIEAMEMYSGSVKLDEALMRKWAVIARKMGNMELALEKHAEIESRMNVQDISDSTFAELMLVYNLMDQPQKALRAAVRACTHPNESRMYLLATQQYRMNMIKECLATTSEALRMSPNHSPLFKLQVMALALSPADHDVARDRGEQLARNLPSDAQAQSILGDVYALRGEYRQAELRYDKAIEIDNKSWVYPYNRAVVRVRLGKLEDAEGDLEVVQDMHPDGGDSLTHVLHGDINVVLKKFPEAIEEYEQALTSNPEDVKAMFKLAAAVYQSEGVAKAVEYYSNAIWASLWAQGDAAAPASYMNDAVQAALGMSEHIKEVVGRVAGSDAADKLDLFTLANIMRVDPKFELGSGMSALDVSGMVAK